MKIRKSKTKEDQPAGNDTRRKFLGAALMILLSASFCVMALHEPWEDELHAWILSRELGFMELFNHMKYEGHLCLWHWILRIFSATGFPVQTLNVISFLFCAAGILFFAEKAPFPVWVKTVFFFSFPMFYFFPTVARPYALIPILLWIGAYLYPLRHKKPFCYGSMIALLIHTHAYMEGFCAILSVFFFIETVKKTRNCKSWQKRSRAFGVFLLIGGSFLLALLQVIGTFSVCINAPEMGSLAGKLGNFWSDMTHYPVEFAKIMTIHTGKVIACGLLFGTVLTGLVILFVRSKKIFFIGFSAIIYQVLFSVFIYRMALQRIYLPMLILIFCFWIAFRKDVLEKGKKQLKTAAVILIVLLSVFTLPETLHYTLLDINRPFSNIESTSNFIRKNIPPTAKILVYPPELLSGTFGAFLPEYTFISSGSGKAFRYFLYEKHQWKKPVTISDETLKQFPFTREGPFYILIQIGMLREYKLDLRDPDRVFQDYQVRMIHGPSVPSFFSAGEDYLILHVVPR